VANYVIDEVVIRARKVLLGDSRGEDAMRGDEEQTWVLGRRRFLFLGGAALAGTLLPGWTEAAEGIVVPEIVVSPGMAEITELLKEAYPPGAFDWVVHHEGPFRRALKEK